MNTTTTPTTILLERTDIDDSIGAIIFIIVVLLWYASSMIFLFGMRIGPSSEIIEDSIRHSEKLFNPSFRDNTDNKRILEELVDKKKRDKLWDIYFGTSGDMSDKINRAEGIRIRNIQRQLVAINEHYGNSACLSSVPDITLLDHPLRIRRRASLDQQIVEEWRTMTDELKPHENRSPPIQKVFSRRQQQIKGYLSIRKQSKP